MFRAQQNAFDDAVAKATDENLTQENWEFILDVCDRASYEDSGPKDVVAAMIKRLAHRNANVQLYTLELANSLSQNCGPKVHQELASRSFTDAMLRLASDRNTHQQVKTKILERMAEWSEMFSKDPGLGIMEQAYTKLKSQNPNLQPPSKPHKQQITDVDRQKEEDELQMALELSVKDRQPSVSAQGNQEGQSSEYASTSQQQDAPAQPIPSGTTAATVSRVRALFDFQPTEPTELQFKKGDIIAVLESVYKDWWKGSLRGQTGIFPLNYVEKLSDPTHEELQREAHMEAEVFAEIKNVEKLLTLLSTSNSEANVRDNDEITTLYHSTLAIRPKLIELIGKYSQRKDDFTQLNEKFIKARRDYETLLETSMSQPPPSAYGRPGPYGYAGGAQYPPQGPPQQQQHDPARYYSPQPQDSRTPQPHNPPQGGPQPFYMAGQAAPAQLPAHHQTPYPPTDPGEQTPGSAGGIGSGRPPLSDPYDHRPQSTYDNPQELSSYTSPMDARPQSFVPPQFQAQQQQGQAPQAAGQNEYSPSIYSPPEDPNDQQQQPPPHHQQQYQQHQQHPQQQHPGAPSQLPYNLQHAQPPPQAQAQPPQASYPANSGPPYNGNTNNQAGPPPAQPSYQPPKVPSPGPGQGPGQSANPYPTVNSGGGGGGVGAPQTTYQAYQPPRQQGPGQQGYASPGPNPSDYYR